MYIYICSKGHKHRSQEAADNCHYCKSKGTKINRPGFSIFYRRILPFHTKEMPIFTNNIRRDWDMEQLSLLKDVKVESRAGVKMGNFYETLSACLLGGHLVKSISEIGARKNGYEREIRPDIISDKHKHIIESKACRQRSQLILYDTQVEGYITACRMKNYEVYYAIWRHDFPGIHSYTGYLKELYRSFGEYTLAGIIIPLSMIVSMWKFEDFPKYDYIYAKRAARYTRVQTKFMNDILLHTEQAINKLGLNPKDYTIERFISPKKLMVENVKVNQIPIIVIKDKDPERWIRTYDDDVPF